MAYKRRALGRGIQEITNGEREALRLAIHRIAGKPVPKERNPSLYVRSDIGKTRCKHDPAFRVKRTKNSEPSGFITECMICKKEWAKAYRDKVRGSRQTRTPRKHGS